MRHLRAMAVVGAVLSIVTTSSVAHARGLTAAGGATTGTVLTPLTQYYDMVVDPATQRVFVSGGPSQDAVVVVGFDGVVDAVIEDQPGATGLAVAGSTLYVARQGDDLVATFDTTTLAAGETLGLGGKLDPAWMAVAGGRLWVTVACPSDRSFVSIDLATDAVRVYPYDSEHRPGCGRFILDPSDPDHLIDASIESVPTKLFEYDVSTDPATFVQGDYTEDGYGLFDLVVTPDGSSLIGAGSGVNVFDLQTPPYVWERGFEANNGVRSVALVGGGTHVAASSWWSPGSVTIFPIDGTEASATFPLPGAADRGLRVAPDGSTLFAVTASPGSPISFHVLVDVDLARSAVTLGVDDAEVAPGDPVVLSGVLTLAAGSEAAEGQTVHVMASRNGGPEQEIGTTVTGPGGSYSFTDHPVVDSTYRVTWPAAPGYVAASSGQSAVDVHKFTSTLPITGPSTIKYKTAVALNVHLGAFADTDQLSVRLYKQPYAGARTLVGTKSVDPDTGDVMFTVGNMTKKTTFTAEWDGDDRYLPKTSLKKIVEVVPLLTTALGGYYGTSGLYKLYHKGDVGAVVGKLTPAHPGKLMWFYLQKKVNGSWKTLDTAWVKMNGVGVGAATFISQTLGVYRIQVGFEGDNDHYFIWVNSALIKYTA